MRTFLQYIGESTFSNRQRFNWGFHDGAHHQHRGGAADRNAMGVKMASHPDQVYAHGFRKGHDASSAGEYDHDRGTTTSDKAWKESGLKDGTSMKPHKLSGKDSKGRKIAPWMVKEDEAMESYAPSKLHAAPAPHFPLQHKIPRIGSGPAQVLHRPAMHFPGQGSTVKPPRIGGGNAQMLHRPTPPPPRPVAPPPKPLQRPGTPPPPKPKLGVLGRAKKAWRAFQEAEYDATRKDKADSEMTKATRRFKDNTGHDEGDWGRADTKNAPGPTYDHEVRSGGLTENLNDADYKEAQRAHEKAIVASAKSGALDHTKNPFHKVLDKHGFKHQGSAKRDTPVHFEHKYDRKGMGITVRHAGPEKHWAHDGSNHGGTTAKALDAYLEKHKGDYVQEATLVGLLKRVVTESQAWNKEHQGDIGSELSISKCSICGGTDHPAAKHVGSKDGKKGLRKHDLLKK